MATKTRKPRSKKPRKDVYQEVTNSIVEAFESGDLKKWSRPWKTGLHKNAVSGKDYRGVNQFILFLRSLVNGYESNLWLTYKQAKKLEGHVKKGERGTQIVFWKFGEKERKNAQGEVIRDKDGKPKTEWALLYATMYTVFNADQCEGLDESKLAKHAITGSSYIDETVENYVFNTGAEVVYGQSQAFYDKHHDLIGMPKPEAFDDHGAFVATITHELTHWTGHKNRCDRDMGERFGDAGYAAEELVAEMGSAFLCAKFGVEGKLQHPEYISHWLGVLKADKTAIFTAASKAQQAVDWLDKTVAETAEEQAENEAAEVAGRAA